MANRYRRAGTAAKVGIFSNLGLAVVKAVVGVAAGSIALVADAIHSLADLLTSAVVLVGLRIAERPADENHPYGHTRAETIAAAFIAGPLTISGFVMAWSAVTNLSTPRPAPEAAALWTALAAVVLKEILYRYKIRVGRRSGSRSVMADAWHHRSDALSSAAVLLGLALTRLDASLWWADPAAALLVCGFVIWVGVGALRGAVGDLMDEHPGSALEEMLRGITALLRQVLEGRAAVENCYQGVVRPGGNRRARQIMEQVRFHVASGLLAEFQRRRVQEAGAKGRSQQYDGIGAHHDSRIPPLDTTAIGTRSSQLRQAAAGADDARRSALAGF